MKRSPPGSSPGNRCSSIKDLTHRAAINNWLTIDKGRVRDEADGIGKVGCQAHPSSPRASQQEGRLVKGSATHPVRVTSYAPLGLDPRGAIELRWVRRFVSELAGQGPAKRRSMSHRSGIDGGLRRDLVHLTLR